MPEDRRSTPWDGLRPMFRGLVNRKNKFPGGEVRFKQAVPLEVVQLVLTVQLAGSVRLLFCCKVQPGASCQYTVTVLPEWLL